MRRDCQIHLQQLNTSVSIVAALGLVSGVCGRTWQIPTGTGLNNYIILIARSAIGKDAMHDGISNLMAYTIQQYPDLKTANQFVDFADPASGQALQKNIAKNNSFVNVTGELGLRIQQLSRSLSKPDSPMQSLFRIITNVYSKSSPTSKTSGIKYSDSLKDIESTSWVSYSLIGESTPNTFYESLTDEMMSNDFVSRLIAVEYTGERPPENAFAAQNKTPSSFLLGWFQDLLRVSLQLNVNNQPITVLASPEAWTILQAYNQECDNLINQAGDDESKRQLGNRAHLKAFKIASLLAVADNCRNPVITTEHAQWAIGFVNRSNSTFLHRINSGDVGDGDHVREEKLVSIIKEYFLAQSLPESAKRFAPLRHKLLIPRKYLQQRTKKVSCFANHPLKATTALKQTIYSLIEAGVLKKADKIELQKNFHYFGECYYILDYGGPIKPTTGLFWKN